MWIESHVALERHPKLLMLQTMTGWTIKESIGSLHQLWYWAAHYAEDGDLRPYKMPQINTLLALPKDSKALIKSKFVDEKPYLRLHDWWDYFGRFLQVKYKNYPEKWLQIKVLYKNPPNNSPKRIAKRQDLPNQPNQTLTTKEMELLNSASPTPRPKGATARPLGTHVKGCTCEVCWSKVMR